MLFPQKTKNEKWTWSPCWVAWLLLVSSFSPASYGWNLWWVPSEGPKLWLLNQWCSIPLVQKSGSYTILDFWSQLVCVIVRKSLLLCSCFHLCPRWWNYYDWSVEKWEEKDSSGVSKWSNSIQFHHLTLYPVFAWYLLLLSPFHLLPGCLFFHHENVL